MTTPHLLSEIISEDVRLNLVEPDIYIPSIHLECPQALMTPLVRLLFTTWWPVIDFITGSCGGTQ